MSYSGFDCPDFYGDLAGQKTTSTAISLIMNIEDSNVQVAGCDEARDARLLSNESFAIATMGRDSVFVSAATVKYLIRVKLEALGYNKNSADDAYKALTGEMRHAVNNGRFMGMLRKSGLRDFGSNLFEGDVGVSGISYDEYSIEESDDEDSTNWPLIVGVSISGGVFCVIIIGFIVYRLSARRSKAIRMTELEKEAVLDEYITDPKVHDPVKSTGQEVAASDERVPVSDAYAMLLAASESIADPPGSSTTFRGIDRKRVYVTEEVENLTSCEQKVIDHMLLPPRRSVFDERSVDVSTSEAKNEEYIDAVFEFRPSVDIQNSYVSEPSTKDSVKQVIDFHPSVDSFTGTLVSGRGSILLPPLDIPPIVQKQNESRRQKFIKKEVSKKTAGAKGGGSPIVNSLSSCDNGNIVATTDPYSSDHSGVENISNLKFKLKPGTFDVENVTRSRSRIIRRRARQYLAISNDETVANDGRHGTVNPRGTPVMSQRHSKLSPTPLRHTTSPEMNVPSLSCPQPPRSIHGFRRSRSPNRQMRSPGERSDTEFIAPGRRGRRRYHTNGTRFNGTALGYAKDRASNCRFYEGPTS